eukprot:1147173-Pelagomonas_calceolata.AAC.4
MGAATVVVKHPVVKINKTALKEEGRSTGAGQGSNYPPDAFETSSWDSPDRKNIISIYNEGLRAHMH